MSSKKKKALIGEEFTNKVGDKFKIIGYDENDRGVRIVQFDDGTVQRESTRRIWNGCEIYNKSITPTVFGVGINDVGFNHVLYYRWVNMLGRCYSEKHVQYKHYGAKGVTVESYFFKFSNYIEFVSTLENYDLLIENPKEYQIDKDIKKGRQNIYSRDTISIVKFSDNLEEENSNKRVPVAMYSLEGNFIKNFESITLASEETHIPIGNIAKCVRGESKSAGGYRWEKISVTTK